MSTAHELFWKAMKPFPKHGDKESLQLLKLAASQWRDAKKYFGAGYSMAWAEKAAWGDEEEVRSCMSAALQDYQQCVDTQEPCSYEGLAALIKWSAQLDALYTYFRESNDAGIYRASREEVLEELAQRLATCYGTSSHAEYYLVKGVWLESDLEEDWKPSFPPYEVNWGEETWNSVNGIVRITLPPAFHLLVTLGDYQGAHSVIERCPDAFTTPGLRGWKAAVEGFLRQDEAPEKFAEAADAFAEDRPPSGEELEQRQVGWSSMNVDLWSKYFRSRSMLATTVGEPRRAKELVRTAATAIHGHLGWGHGGVIRYQILVQTLAHLVGEEPSLSPEQAREQFLRDASWTGAEAYDAVAVQFLSLASQAFEGFKTDPAQELATGRLRDALDALARIPLIGPDIIEAVTHEIGANVWNISLGPVRTWIYRTLENIKNEDHLRRIILRLVQASLPLYAQIVHGPIEWGRDIVVFLKSDDHLELRMYQVKCGDLTIPDWRTARAQLEEMFQGPLPESIVPNDLNPLHIGILVYNGHPNANVAPLMDGWHEEQRRDHGREYQFIHLDELVQWISRDRLINEFRRAIADVGLDPIV